ncbi:MAG: hypothetical protein ACMUIA_10200 [bacterium]
MKFLDRESETCFSGSRNGGLNGKLSSVKRKSEMAEGEVKEKARQPQISCFCPLGNVSVPSVI